MTKYLFLYTLPQPICWHTWLVVWLEPYACLSYFRPYNPLRRLLLHDRDVTSHSRNQQRLSKERSTVKSHLTFLDPYPQPGMSTRFTSQEVTSKCRNPQASLASHLQNQQSFSPVLQVNLYSLLCKWHVISLPNSALSRLFRRAGMEFCSHVLCFLKFSNTGARIMMQQFKPHLGRHTHLTEFATESCLYFLF